MSEHMFDTTTDEDFVDILINWLDIGSSMRKNDVIYSTIVKLLNEYGATEEMRNNLPIVPYGSRNACF